MANKSKTNLISNAVYINEKEAGVLGIYEGGFQKVFVDEKPVTVTFIDEHEIIPMSETEKKLSKDVTQITKKYETIYAEHKEVLASKNAEKSFVAKRFYSSFDIRSIKKQNKKIDLQKNKQPSVLKSCQLSEMEIDFVNKLLDKAKGTDSAKK